MSMCMIVNTLPWYQLTNVFSSTRLNFLEFFVFSVKASCEDLDTIRSATAAVTIIYAIIAIVSLVGSIYGCIGTCCAPRVNDFIHTIYMLRD